MFRTLPRQLFLYLVPGMLLVLLVAGWSVDRLVDEQHTTYFDTTLAAKAQSIVALTEQGDEGVELEDLSVAMPEFSQAEEPDYFLIVDEDGESVFVSSSANGNTEAFPNFISKASTAERPNAKHFDYPLPDGRSGRWIGVSYFPRMDFDDDEEEKEDVSELAVAAENATEATEAAVSDSEAAEAEESQPYIPGEPALIGGVLVVPELMTAYVGTSRTAFDQLSWIIELILILTGLAIAASIVIIAGLGIKRAVEPISRLGDEIAAVDEHSLSSRISLQKPVIELEVLVEHFNHLLSRLQAAFVRERQFSADVAHELRTPVAEMRSLIEVQARFPEDPVLSKNYSENLLASTLRIKRTVEQLLALSKSDSDTLDLGGSIDLIALLHKHIKAAEDELTARDLKLRFNSNTESLVVKGSQIWPLILMNVINNAIAHGERAGTIDINVTSSDDNYRVSISNATSELSEADIENVFDRLWSKDTSRTNSQHSGLGLALVAAYARHLHLLVHAELTPSPKQGPAEQVFTLTISGNNQPDRAQKEDILPTKFNSIPHFQRSLN